MGKHKINQLAAVRGKNDSTESQNPIYRELEKAFSYFFNPEAFGTKVLRAPDETSENSLRMIMQTPMNSITAFVGNAGIGKTCSLIECFGCINNASILQPDDGVVIFPTFFQNYLPDDSEHEKDNTKVQKIHAMHIKSDIAKSVASICHKIEDGSPEFRAWFFNDGQNDFYNFIKNTNPKALEDIKLSDYEEKRTIRQILEQVQKNEPFIYYASKLKFYLSSNRIPYNRLLIIVDGIDSLEEINDQNIIVSRFMQFYKCMSNFPAFYEGNKVYVNLILSVRPFTFRRLRECHWFAAYRSMNVIYKENHINLVDYFQRKMELLPEHLRIQNDAKWEVALRAILTLDKKYDGKYAKMIMGLSNLDFRTILKAHELILSNPIWVKGDYCEGMKDEDMVNSFSFNNITVIRSLACRTQRVYYGEGNEIIPNVFYNDVNENNTMITLYIISYLVNQIGSSAKFLQRSISLEDVIRDLTDVFGEKVENILDRPRLKKSIDYLHACGIVNLEYERLYLTLRGMEIWSMLSQDSVLVELYREDFFREYDPNDKDGFKSSMDLFNENNQHKIFIELYIFIGVLLVDEEKLIEAVIRRGTQNKYASIFTSQTISGHLISGINNSIDFSGKCNDPEIQRMRFDLLERIDRISNQIN